MQNMSLYGGNPQQAMYAHHGNHMVSSLEIHPKFTREFYSRYYSEKKLNVNANLTVSYVNIQYVSVTQQFVILFQHLTSIWCRSRFCSLHVLGIN